MKICYYNLCRHQFHFFIDIPQVSGNLSCMTVNNKRPCKSFFFRSENVFLCLGEDKYCFSILLREHPPTFRKQKINCVVKCELAETYEHKAADVIKVCYLDLLFNSQRRVLEIRGKQHSWYELLCHFYYHNLQRECLCTMISSHFSFNKMIFAKIFSSFYSNLKISILKYHKIKEDYYYYY